jgi:2-keto-4-pentenoate hydratase
MTERVKSAPGVRAPQAKARALYDARRTGVPIAPFTDTEPGLTMTDGYAIQRELVAMLLADGDTITGYKVGLTSKPMQQMVGVDSPDFGPVLTSTCYPNDGMIHLDAFIAPKVEAEISFIMAERLAGPNTTIDEARHAISGAVASLEIVDSRITDWRVQLADTVADLASNGATVLSETVTPIAGLDPKSINMTLTCADQIVAAGTGSAALGDPLAVVAWLADTLGELGLALEPGHVVMTGALHAALPLARGDELSATFDQLGRVSLAVV